MQNSKTNPNSAAVLEDFLGGLFHKGEAFLRPRWEQLEDQIRQSPTKAVLIAAGIGYCLHRLPGRSLAGSTLKLAWALAPPAAMAALAGKGLNVLEGKLHTNEPSAKARSSRSAPNEAHV